MFQRRHVFSLGERAHAHAQQTQPLRQRHPLEQQAGVVANGLGVGRVVRQRLVTSDAFKVVVAQLDADGFAHVTLALQVFGHLLAQPREHFAQRCFVAHRV